MSSNATSRATESKPADSALYAPLIETLGPEAGRLSPALAKRVAEAIACSIEAANNEDRATDSVFSRALSVDRRMVGSMGGSWEDLRHPDRLPNQLRSVDMALAGIDGLAEVLAASEYARCAGEDVLGENLTDRLFYALRALSSHARTELEKGRQAAEGRRA